MLGNHRHRLRGDKGQAPRHQIKQHHAQAINIRAGIHRFAHCLLWRHIIGRANHAPQRRQVRRLGALLFCGGLGKLGDAKIPQHQAFIGIEQHILRLDIAVNDAVRVRVFQRACRLRDKSCRLQQGQRAFPHHAVSQRAPRNIGHHQIGKVFLFAVLKNGQDVGMLQRGHRVGLAAETLQEALASVSIGQPGEHQHLDCHLPMRAGLLRQVDHPHPSASQDTLKRTRSQGHAQQIFWRPLRNTTF